jgi:hypothetical protein
MQYNDSNKLNIQGHIKIHDPTNGEVLINKRNAIHYENMSIALAESLGNQGTGFVYEMSFGNGGTSVDPTGVITYLTPNSTGTTASLYNQTYSKVVDDRSVNNTDPTRNKMEIRHVSGQNYTDLFVNCLLDYSEPNGQDAFDTSGDSENQFVFDELGLRSYAADGNGRLLTHVIFHPVQKSLNRLIQIDYTVRIQSLSGGNS